MNRSRVVILCSFILIALSATEPAFGFPLPVRPRPKTYQTNQQHADNAIIEALIFLETKVPPDQWCYYQFFEFLDSSDEDLEDDTNLFRAILPMTSTGPIPTRPFPIDKAGRVWAFNITEAGWNREAVQSVTRLDTLLREPNINHQLAEELRRAVGAKLDKTTFHCEGMLPGNWFVREVQETDRHRDDPENIAYYNLLYARERFGEYESTYEKKSRLPVKSAEPVPTDPGPEPKLSPNKSWPGGIGPDGKYYPPGIYYDPDERAASVKAREKWREDKARWDA